METNFLEVNKVRQIIEDQLFYKGNIKVSLLESLYHYSYEPIYALINIPSFDNSAMDGYAFNYDDYSERKQLKVKYIVSAGETKAISLKSGEAAKIFTGALIPKGADTVIMQEKVKIKNNIISLEEKGLQKGQNIRLEASQSKKGDLLIPANTHIKTGIIGLLAGFGINEIKIFSPPKVGIIVTGNELMKAGEYLEKGQIYESNSITLQAALKEINIKSLFDIKIKDDKSTVLETIENKLKEVDILLITGGISVGEYDFVKESLEKLQIRQLFYKIRQKPGKPLFMGKKGERFIFALPGNPASVLSCFYQYVRPFLEGIKGRKDFYYNRSEAIINSNYEKRNELTDFLKGYYENGYVSVLPSQESYKMDSFVNSNCFIEISGRERMICKGEKVTIWNI